MRPTFIIQCPAKVSVNVVGWAAPQLNPVTTRRSGRLWSCKGYTCIGVTFMKGPQKKTSPASSRQHSASEITSLAKNIQTGPIGPVETSPVKKWGSNRTLWEQWGKVCLENKGKEPGEHLSSCDWWGRSSRLWGGIVSGNVPQIEGRRFNEKILEANIRSSGRSWKGF